MLKRNPILNKTNNALMTTIENEMNLKIRIDLTLFDLTMG